MSRISRLAGSVTLVLLAGVLSGCVATGDRSTVSSSGLPSTSTTAELTESLTVFAAASLQGAMTELLHEFGKRHKQLDVKEPTLDGSATLSTQISEGAPADVFASADEETMSLITGELADPPSLFATNTLQIAVQPGNPQHVLGLSDLASPRLQVILCSQQVPCGAAAHRLLALDGVEVAPVSEEQNVKAVLTKVRLREADAGLVYRTDVASANGAVEGIDIVGAERATNNYPIAVLKAAQNPHAATAFVQYVLSSDGQAIMAKYGFGKP